MTELSNFTVTEKAMRPASTSRQCFYCQQIIGQKHKTNCVLINRKATVRLTVEYDVEVPAFWTAENVEFHRNDGSWCSSNIIGELDELDVRLGCLCSATKCRVVAMHDDEYLDE